MFPGDGEPVEADVGVRDGLIAAVGSLSGAEAVEVVDGTGAMLCPGFIDMHAHSALASFDDPLLAPKILQGFTTEVINPDGLAPAPVGGQASRRGGCTSGRSRVMAPRNGCGRPSPSTSTTSTGRGPR